MYWTFTYVDKEVINAPIYNKEEVDRAFAEALEKAEAKVRAAGPDWARFKRAAMRRHPLSERWWEEFYVQIRE